MKFPWEVFTFCGKFGCVVGDKERKKEVKEDVRKQLRSFYAEWWMKWMRCPPSPVPGKYRLGRCLLGDWVLVTFSSGRAGTWLHPCNLINTRQLPHP